MIHHLITIITGSTYSVSNATAQMRRSTQLIFQVIFFSLMLMMKRYSNPMLIQLRSCKITLLVSKYWTAVLHLSSWSCFLFLSFNSSTRGSNFILLVWDLKLGRNSFFPTVAHHNHIMQIVICNHIRVVCHIRLYFACLCWPQCCVGDINGPV